MTENHGVGGSIPSPGTTAFQHPEILAKSTHCGSGQRVCYGELLQDVTARSSISVRKHGRNRVHGCYSQLLLKRPSGLHLRGSTFYLRRWVPQDLQAIVGRAEIWKSLRTDSRLCATRRFPSVSAQIEAEFERLRHQAGLTIDSVILGPNADDLRVTFDSLGGEAGRPREQQVEKFEPSLGEIYERYVGDPTHSWAASTRQAYETTRSVVVDILGAATPVKTLARSDVRTLIDALRVLPKNAVKIFPKLTLRQAAAHGRANPSLERISTANANAYLSNFSTFLNWCVGEELVVKNAARGLRLPDEIARRDKRHPFAAEQLKLIFHAPLFTGCEDGERGYAAKGNARPRNARFWVPLIALHTGMRLNEICQLDSTDIRTVDGISCVSVTQKSMNGSTDKVLKTAASERIIPLHPMLLELGLVAFAEEKRRQAQAKLFGEIVRGPRGVRAVAFSKWFTHFLASAGARRERTSFHSFRHNFRDELRIARVDHAIGMSLGGWIGGPSPSSAASESYGQGFRVEALQDAIMRLRFADIDLSHLRR
jgi:integrase